MALSPEKIAALKASCKLVKKNKPLKFFYCASGEDGNPEILIGKNITNEAKALKKTAKKKKFVKGTVARADNKLQFVTETPTANKFAKNLKTFFGAKIGELKKAQVKGLDEVEGAEDSAEQPQAEIEPAVDDVGGGDPITWSPSDLLQPADLPRVAKLEVTFKGKGMDDANASDAAKTATVLKKNEAAPQADVQQKLAAFALSMAARQVTRLEEEVAALGDAEVDASEEGAQPVLALLQGADSAIGALAANARVYLSLARKAAPADEGAVAKAQTLTDRLGALLSEKDTLVQQLTADLTESQDEEQEDEEQEDEEQEDEEQAEAKQLAELLAEQKEAMKELLAEQREELAELLEEQRNGAEPEEEDESADTDEGPEESDPGADSPEVTAQPKPAGPATPAALQERLNALGFSCGAVDGLIGAKTQAAVRNFQAANGLTADGLVGPKTLAALGFTGSEVQKQPPKV